MSLHFLSVKFLFILQSFSFYSFSSGFLSDRILKVFVYKYINNGLYKL